MTKRIIAVAAALALTTSWAHAQEVKVGVNLPYTGIGAEFAQLVDRGMELYLKLNADKVKPYKITLIKRDVKDPGGANAKIAVQELLTQDNVDILAGWIYSPNAIASAPLVTAGRRLAVIMNAGTAHITNLSPYYVRTSFSMWHAGYALGEAAAKNLRAKTAVVGYTDFPPGKDSLAAFKRSFEANGGKVIDEIPMGGAGAVPDFTPFFQRAKDKKPDVFFVFVPAGDHAAAVVKTYAALGMKEAGIKLIGPGDVTDDDVLPNMGDAAIGAVTAHMYSAAHPSKLNKDYVAAFEKANNFRPNFISVGAYDGMHLIYEALKKTNGDTDGDKLIAAMKGMKWESPRGPISIDPDTRDIVQNIYIRKVEKVDGKLYNVEFATFEAVKDPVKAEKK